MENSEKIILHLCCSEFGSDTKNYREAGYDVRMIDKNEADDKIIAVMAKDEMYNKWKDISDVPESLLNRLKHYFLTYILKLPIKFYLFLICFFIKFF